MDMLPVMDKVDFPFTSMGNTTKEAWELEVGMEFDSEDRAFEFYNKYAGNKGFSVRKSFRTITTSDVITRRMFVCSKEGFPVKKNVESYDKRKRRVTRTGCLARMVIKIMPSGKYYVSEFEENHNHLCASPSKAHMLRSQRSITASQSAQVRLAYDTGIAPMRIYELMEKESGGRENIGFTHVDLKNQQRSDRMKALEKGEASALLNYFTKKRIENPSFFYAIQVDDNGDLTSIFWADAKSILDYAYFGDVLCFDTTFKTNNYHRPLAPFVGVNHHKQSILFGAALLFDESIKTFKWLFEIFQNTMSEKLPKTIFTDQCAAMITALKEVWPETTHRLCVWHIYKNVTTHLSHVFRSQKSFVTDFGNCVYDHEEEEEFLLAWDAMLDKYNLRENEWLKSLYKEKEKWAMVYGRQTFSAQMMSTQRSESINSLLKRYLCGKLDVSRFFKHFDRLLEERRYTELQADFYASQSAPSIPPLQMLRQVSKVYTPAIFEMFQKEFQLVMGYSIENIEETGNKFKYSVVFEENDRPPRTHIVEADSLTGTFVCSCKKFEFAGILCRHVLKVFDLKKIKIVPSQYILKRWTKDAKSGIVKNHEGLEIVKDPQATLSRRYNYLCRIFVQICAKAAECEETFTLLENKSGKLMDEVIKGLQNASVSSHYLASTPNDQVEYHPQNVGMDSEQNEGYDYGLNTKTIYPTTSIVINGIKKKKRVGRIRQPKRVLNRKKKKQKSKGEDRDETSITQSDNAQHSLNISQKNFVQGFTHSNYQCNIPFILSNNQFGSVSASSHLNLVHILPTLSNSLVDLQHTTQLHQLEEYSVGTTQHPNTTGFQFQPN